MQLQEPRITQGPHLKKLAKANQFNRMNTLKFPKFFLPKKEEGNALYRQPTNPK